jgi:hypothetical protein
MNSLARLVEYHPGVRLKLGSEKKWSDPVGIVVGAALLR